MQNPQVIIIRNYLQPELCPVRILQEERRYRQGKAGIADALFLTPANGFPSGKKTANGKNILAYNPGSG